MTEGGDPLLFLGRVDQAADQLAMLGGTGVEEVNRHIVNNLSSLYNILRYKANPSFPARPSLVPRSMRSSATRTLMTRLRGRW